MHRNDDALTTWYRSFDRITMHKWSRKRSDTFFNRITVSKKDFNFAQILLLHEVLKLRVGVENGILQGT